MSADAVRKMPVQVMMSGKLLDRVDAMVRAKAPPDRNPDKLRSELIRRYVVEGLERDERAGEEGAT